MRGICFGILVVVALAVCRGAAGAPAAGVPEPAVLPPLEERDVVQTRSGTIEVIHLRYLDPNYVAALINGSGFYPEISIVSFPPLNAILAGPGQPGGNISGGSSAFPFSHTPGIGGGFTTPGGATSYPAPGGGAALPSSGRGAGRRSAPGANPWQPASRQLVEGVRHMRPQRDDRFPGP